MNTVDAIILMITGTTLSVSIIQVIVILTVVGTFLIWGKYRLGILIAYFYCLYWTFISQRMLLSEVFGNDRISLFVFVFMGFSLAILGIFSLFQERNN